MENGLLTFRGIRDGDIPAVKALWGALAAQSIDANCWPALSDLSHRDDRWIEHLRRNNQWAVVEGDGVPTGFTFWVLDPDGNAYVKAIAALEEAAYLGLVVASVTASRTEAYGYLQRHRPERKWFETIGATFEPCGYKPMTPDEEARHPTRQAKLAARVPTLDKIIVPVTLIPAIEARIAALGGGK